MKRRSIQPKTRKGFNAPAPYTKYGKRPHRYSEAYTKWRARVAIGASKGR